MIWEQGCVVIVMLTRLQDNGHQLCHRYWPEEGSEQYHIFEVTSSADPSAASVVTCVRDLSYVQVHLVSEHVWCDDYLVRSVYLKNTRTGETRTVTQFHFRSWPAHGVPTSTKALLEFRRYVCVYGYTASTYSGLKGISLSMKKLFSPAQESEQVLSRPLLPHLRALQRRRRAVRHLRPHRHGAQPYGQGLQGDRHRGYPGARERPARRHGTDQAAVRVLPNGSGRGGARYTQGATTVRHRNSNRCVILPDNNTKINGGNSSNVCVEQ